MLNKLTFIILLFTVSISSVFAQTFDPSQVKGFWRGTWFNNTFQSTDSAFLDIDYDGTQNTLTMILDLDGNVFGGANPDPATMTGTYDQNGFSVTGTSPTYGDMFFNGDASGYVTGRMPNVPNPAIDSTTLSGTYNETNIDMTYIVYFVGGSGTADGVINLVKDPVSNVEPIDGNLHDFQLYQNFPNPFNPATKIRFAISETRFTILKVYDILGNEVAILVNEEKPAGTYEIIFNTAQLPSGVYFYQLQTGSFVETKRMILMK